MDQSDLLTLQSLAIMARACNGAPHYPRLSRYGEKMSFEARFDKIMPPATSLGRHREPTISRAAPDLKFSRKDSPHELDLTVERLNLFGQTREPLERRQPLGGRDSWVAVMLSCNGSAWLNIVITAAHLAGNKVLVRFSSRGSRVMALTEKIYRPIFGADIQFYRASAVPSGFGSVLAKRAHIIQTILL
jgi:hypothetical protein